MGIARRWTMAGPWRHPNGVFYLRRELPADLWAARARLAEFGIKVGGKEVRKSLATRDPKEAAQRYVQAAAEQESLWAAWREGLASGPTILTERNRVALAGELVRDFIARNEDDPTMAPDVDAPVRNVLLEVADRLTRLPVAHQRHLIRAASKITHITGAPAREAAWSEVTSDPLINEIADDVLADPLMEALEAQHGETLDRVLVEKGETIAPHSRSAVLLETLLLHSKASDALRDMARTRDFSQPEWLKGLPEYRPPETSVARKGLTFAAIIDAEAERRSRGKDAKPMPEATARKFRAIANEFVAFRRRSKQSSPSNAVTVRGEELDQWRDALLAAGEVGNRTIHYKLGSIKTVLRWGNKLFKGELSKAVASVADVSLPDFERKPSRLSAMRPDEAVTILKAARKEADPRLRWLPWVCAYTGLRIGEASRLEREDFFESAGKWFMQITSSGKRSLKTINARRIIPIYKALLQEGFREFVQSVPKGRLFTTGADTAILRWVRSGAVGVTRKELSPNHGWRHLFEDLCRRDGVSDDARLYLVGHSSGGADQQYGRTDVMLPGLWRELAKVKPFKLR